MTDKILHPFLKTSHINITFTCLPTVIFRHFQNKATLTLFLPGFVTWYTFTVIKSILAPGEIGLRVGEQTQILFIFFIAVIFLHLELTTKLLSMRVTQLITVNQNWELRSEIVCFMPVDIINKYGSSP